MINVLLIEDQRLFSEGIQAVINREVDLQVTAVATNHKDAIHKINEQHIDVVLIDVHLRHIEGIKMTLGVKERYPAIKVILLTTTVDEDLVINGLNVGADGFLLISLYAENLIRAVRDAYNGQVVLSGDVAKILAKKDLQFNKKQILAQHLEHRNIQFSCREIDIAYLLMEGYSNKVIAQKLYLNVGTIKNYISDIYSELDMRNRVEVIEYLDGLLDRNR
ncbi:response regulator [Virgibacillus necropolis]|uniref:DNA-binding response regulator n=1 Tax=Virgibacillus necropolis TaxID=163877 RepID=A0A221M987_9BACI|nr:response regulator transcription factor [Virgibacillus necropolis]ASN04224.1 DNA-binding response regulator [Virgibacillus necropolis]